MSYNDIFIEKIIVPKDVFDKATNYNSWQQKAALDVYRILWYACAEKNVLRFSFN